MRYELGIFLVTHYNDAWRWTQCHTAKVSMLCEKHTQSMIQFHCDSYDRTKGTLVLSAGHFTEVTMPYPKKKKKKKNHSVSVKAMCMSITKIISTCSRMHDRHAHTEYSWSESLLSTSERHRGARWKVKAITRRVSTNQICSFYDFSLGWSSCSLVLQTTAECAHRSSASQ